MEQALVIPPNDHPEQPCVWITPGFPVVFVVFPLGRVCREPYDTFPLGNVGIADAKYLAGNLRLEPFASNARQVIARDVVEHRQNPAVYSGAHLVTSLPRIARGLASL